MQTFFRTRSPHRLVSSCLAFTVAATSVVAASEGQPVRPVYDAEGLRAGASEALDATDAGGLLYLIAREATHGREIWRSDGTPEGTSLLADLCPGPCNGRNFAPVASSTVEFEGDLVFSTASGPAEGLWRSDGTPEGTVQLVDGGILGPIALGDTLVFGRFGAGSAFSLWASDGTPAGTRRISFATPHNLTRIGERAFFFTAPTLLWATDGTPAGTHRVEDLGAAIRTLTDLGGRALIQTGDALWIADEAGAGKILELREGESFHPFAELPATLSLAYFTVFDPDLDATRLWRTDGSAGGTLPLISLCAGPCFFGFNTALPVIAGERLFLFLARPQGGFELWTSDGTPAGTLLLRPVRWGEPADPDRFHVTVLGERLFYADHTIDGTEVEIWTSDGTAAGTRNLGEFSAPEHSPRTFDMIAGDGAAYFAVDAAGQDPRAEIWRSDGTAEGTERLLELEGRFERLLHFFDGRLVFTFDDFERGLEPWVSDGTAAGTELLIDLAAERDGLDPRDLVATRNGLFFTAFQNFQFAPWQSDGTARGTVEAPRLGGSRPSAWIPFGDRTLVFTERNELWVSDGTAEGTVFLRDGVAASSEWTLLGGVVYFLERRDSATTLWRSDGTAAGTRPVADVGGQRRAFHRGLFTAGDTLIFTAPGERPGIWRSDGTTEGTAFFELSFLPLELRSFGGRVHFADLRGGRELWQTDGTAAGTRRSFAFDEVLTGELENLMASDDALFLVTAAEGGRKTLWRSDGTAAGTVAIAELPSRLLTRFAPGSHVAVGGAVFFSLSEPGRGVEVWRADRDGAARVADLCPGRCSSHPQEARAIAGRLYFAAFDPEHGLEPWVSDGTAAGTFRLADVSPGPRSSNPEGFTGFAREIYFAARRPDVGPELWAYDLLGDCRQTTPRACLNGERFEVSVDWRSHFGETATGRGRPIPFSDQSSLFWFFNPENVELVVKVLDGRTINGFFWLFYGALSDVEYWIDARDRLTGREIAFYNPPDEICGDSTIRAFPDVKTPLTVPRRYVPPENAPAVETVSTTDGSGLGCQSDGTTLCLRDGRFRVTAEWRDQDTGRLHPGRVHPGTSESGYFWFFNPENLELIVKVLDGRTINGKFWVFYGALSDVEYTVTVTDTATGVSKIYRNPLGEMCGVDDTRAFDGG